MHKASSFDRAKPRILLVFFAVFYGFLATGQQAMDSLGRIWVADEAGGLSRFEASGSVKMALPIGASASGKIAALAAGKSGDVWAGTMGSGLFRWDEKKQRFERFKSDRTRLASLPSDTITAVGFDPSGDLWAAGPGFAALWLSPLDVFRPYRFESVLAGNRSPSALLFDSKSPDFVWLVFPQGLLALSRKTSVFRFFERQRSEAGSGQLPVFMPSPLLRAPSGPFEAGPDRSVDFSKKQAIGAALFLAAIGTAIWLWRWQARRIRQEEQLKFKIQELETQLLRSQMNPHFISNSLNSIKNYILSNERLAAVDYLSGFAQLMRNMLDHSRSERVQLKEELETLRLYVSMEQLRLKKKFDFSLEVDPGLDQADILVQPLILPPFAENAIRHGLQTKEGKGRLQIRVFADEGDLVYSIEDDGEGRVRSQAIMAATQAEGFRSHEIQITRDRLSLSQKDATIEWIDVADAQGRSTGTRVEVRMKMQPQNASVFEAAIRSQT